MSFRIAHGGNLGDVVWHLPAMIDLARRAGHETFELLLKVNVPASYAEPHPCGSVQITPAFASSAHSLFQAQPYISDCRIWNGEDVDVDLDEFRLMGADLRQGDIATWPCLAFLCSPDLTRPWLTVPDVGSTGRVLVARSGRHRNPAIRYPRIGYFVGMKEENDLGLPWVETPTLLDLAREIAGCRCLIANQSLPMAIASALDVPRILEWSPTCMNVQPHGRKCQPVWTQAQMDEAIRVIGVSPSGQCRCPLTT